MMSILLEGKKFSRGEYRYENKRVSYYGFVCCNWCSVLFYYFVFFRWYEIRYDVDYDVYGYFFVFVGVKCICYWDCDWNYFCVYNCIFSWIDF